MSTEVWVALAIAAAVVVVLVVALLAARRRNHARSEHLRERFGPEYDRLAAGRDTRARRQAEAELERREQRRDHLDIHPLPVESRNRYMDRWRDIQASFVDAPEESVVEAEDLVTRVMRERGYPVAHEFENQAELISVDHPDLVQNYRHAHSTYERAQQHEADTEELRSSIVYYRSLFNELLAA